ncbi:hypothetical protein [Micromonospora sp. CPCC 206061]|uniref:hypothetical protein n=1 Tax=Micromonospora sp. CPCC 206061 TaxID=3122410 RepID=UPI002FF19920
MATTLVRRRPAIFLAAAVAVIVLGVVVAINARTGEISGGPLTLGDIPTETHIPTPVNTTVTYGVLVLRNRGSETATIKSIELVPDGDQGGVEVVDIRVYALSRGADIIGTALNYDPPAQSVPARDSTIPPSNGENASGQELIFGVRGEDPGIAKFKDVEIHYRIGSTRYVLSSRHTVWFCVGKETC